MSTRAIIGYTREDGKFAGGWQWNDGMDLCPLLKEQFDSTEKIDNLISKGVWNNIVSADDTETLEYFKEFTVRPNSDYYLVEVGHCFLLKEKPCDSAEFWLDGDDGVSVEDGRLVFDSIEIANQQDINFLYKFDISDSSWSVLN